MSSTKVDASQLCIDLVNQMDGHRVCMGVSDFDDFYNAHKLRLIRLGWLLSLDRDDAVELAQEAMTRAWQNWDEISSSGSNPAAWTNRVLVNLSSNDRRRHGTQRRWRHLFSVDDAATQLTTPVAEHHDLSLALRRLTHRQREAVVLRYWDDLDLAGCAEVMGVSVGSVKTHLSRAHDVLRTATELTLEEL